MKTAILGFGLEGQSTYKFLTSQQGVSPSDITIIDEKDIQIPQGSKLISGKLCFDAIVNFDVVRRSPGITDTIIKKKLSDIDIFDVVKEKFTSQSQYFFDNYNGYSIGITGTKGKSTISMMTYLTLMESGLKVELVGNVGKPIMDVIDFTNQPDYVVFEISSFMLESLGSFRFNIGIFNTLFSTHTSEHGGFDPYVLAKTRILDNSDIYLIGHQAYKELDHLGYSSKLKESIEYGANGKYSFSNGAFCIDSVKVLGDEGMQLLGEHNRTNVCSTLGICDILNIDFKHFRTVLEGFKGLEHRVEALGKKHGIFWINDAIATTPQATMAALDTFKNEVDTLFYGGIEGDYDHSGVIDRIHKYGVKNIILFPDSGHNILEGLDNSHNYLETREMEEAVKFAIKHTEQSKIALLSCGSPSFSCWSGFKEKGNLFKKYVSTC